MKIKMTTYDDDGNEIVLKEYDVSPVENSVEAQIANLRYHLLAIGAEEETIENAIKVFLEGVEMGKTAHSIKCTFKVMEEIYAHEKQLNEDNENLQY